MTIKIDNHFISINVEEIIVRNEILQDSRHDGNIFNKN